MNENINLTAENLSSSNLHVDHSPMKEGISTSTWKSAPKRVS